MNTTKIYAYVFRTLLDGLVGYELRLLSSRDARAYSQELGKKYDYVLYFKQVL
nr:MAG TPA: hypothetical protein [Microviridae sp.]